MEFDLYGTVPATDATLNEGFDEAFVTPPAANQIPQPSYHFNCPVCLTFPRDPVQIHCRQLLCWSCCAKIMEITLNGNAHRCPMCREPFVNFNLIQFADVNVRNQFSIYRVRCPYGCVEELDPEQMDWHQRLHCPKRPVQCIMVGCTNVLLAKDMGAHGREHEIHAIQRQKDRARQREVQHAFGPRPTRINPNEDDEPKEEHEEPFDDRSDRASSS